MHGKRKAKKLIAKAADVIERDGLAYRALGSVGGPKCILGALNYVVSGSPKGQGYDSEKVQALFRAEEILRSEVGGIAHYSDTHTKDEVVAKLREIAS